MTNSHGRRRWAILALALAVAALAAPSTAGAIGVPSTSASTGGQERLAVAPAPVRPVLSRVASGLDQPVMVRSAADGTSRLFVVERTGRVRVVSGGRITGTYLDLRSRVNSSGGEQGLLGLAFAPDFSHSHLLWVTYTRGDGALVLARLKAGTPSAPVVSASTHITVLVVPHPGADNHNGGDIAFGPDGYLYLGTGDGGFQGDPNHHAQSLHSLSGKMLRLNVRCAGHAYCIPPTNPYIHTAGVFHEIWMVGLRNPWRWSFDSATGNQWIGDVGQDSYEEVDVASHTWARGANFGWSCREGLAGYNGDQCRAGVTYRLPTVVLCHADNVSGCPSARAAEALIGGYVYRGPRYPAAAAEYVFADYVTGKVWGYRGGQLTAPQSFAGVTGFGLDDGREIYAVTYDGGLDRVSFAA